MESRMKGPVFVLIRFPLSRFQACKNSLTKNLSVHRNYSGAVSGLSKTVNLVLYSLKLQSEKVQVIEGSWPRDRGVAILSFDTFKEAQRWKDSVPGIRQPDWMDGVDLVMVPVGEMPPGNKCFIQILDLRITDIDRFMTEYASEASRFLSSSGATAEVVSTKDVFRVKGGWNPELLLIHFWMSPEEFEAAYTSDEYQLLKEKRFESADTSSVVFQLEPLTKNRY